MKKILLIILLACLLGGGAVLAKGIVCQKSFGNDSYVVCHRY